MRRPCSFKELTCCFDSLSFIAEVRVQKEGKKAQLVGTATTKDVSNEMIGGFTGVFIGMYASGNGKANTNPADFDWFDFE